jgi:hypothetical protein
MFLFSKLKGPEGISLKDRKEKNRVYKQTFLGKEAVTWFLEHGVQAGVKSREDAIRLGNEYLNERCLFHATRGAERKFCENFFDTWKFPLTFHRKRI